jgi:hypothetical protein
MTSNREADVAAYRAIRDGRERRMRSVIADLEEEAAAAARGLASPSPRDRHLVPLSARRITSAAAAFAEAASALAALREVKFLSTVPDGEG